MKATGMRAATMVGLALTMVAGVPAAGWGQSPPPPQTHDVTDLAKKTQNPVGDVISMPFQVNFNTGGDLEDTTFLNLNVQPVIPFKLGANWNVISRTIVPINSMPGPDSTRYSGVGDIQQQIYLTPSSPGAIIWGVGPVLSLPTATARPAETGAWAGGIGAVIVKMTGPFVLGGLINNLWTMTDSGGPPETNLFTLQPFINFNFGQGYALGFAPVITANWDADDGEEWTVPLGMGISRTTVFNGRPMTVGAQYYHNVERPTGSAGSQIRLVVTLIFPSVRR